MTRMILPFPPGLAVKAVIFLIIWTLTSSTIDGQTVNDPPARQLQQLASVKNLPTKAKRWALIIGIDQYVDSQISPLKGAANDARSLADSLVRHAGFPADQVIVLASDQPTERQPTRVNILRRLSNIASAVPKDGLLLVSFAGHGMERGGRAYLLPSDAQISDEITFLEDTAVSVERMKERIKATGVKQVLVLLDACRNDPGGRADAPNNLTPAYVNALNFDIRNQEVEAFAILYATAVGQRAYEYSEKRQGYFTWAVVDGLKGAAANERGEVTLSQLLKYVQEAVPKRITIDLGASKQQRPFATIEGYLADELVLAVGTPGSSPSVSGTSIEPASVELAFWDSIKNSTSQDDFKAYLKEYPAGRFSSLAQNRLNSLETSAKADPVPPAADRATEIAFWDSIKNSNNADDFHAYLRKFPKGDFLELANNRLRVIGESVKKEEEKEAAQRIAAEISRQTKTYRISWGFKGSMNTQFWPAKIVISPGRFQIIDDAGKDVKWDCPSFQRAVIDSLYIREIGCGVGKCRISAESSADATAILNGIQASCRGKLGIQVAPLTPEITSRLGLDSQKTGIVVVNITANGPAAASGVRVDDIIEEANGFQVKTPEELVAASATSTGIVRLLVNRRGERMQVNVAPDLQKGK